MTSAIMFFTVDHDDNIIFERAGQIIVAIPYRYLAFIEFLSLYGTCHVVSLIAVRCKNGLILNLAAIKIFSILAIKKLNIVDQQ